MTIQNNVVSDTTDETFNVGNTLPAANGNIFADNCTWKGDGTGGVDTTYGIAQDNVAAYPELAANWETGVVKVMNPACAAKLPPGSRFLP